jgi:hypothetical protein
MTTKRQSYINPKIVKFTALLHLLIGSGLLILSGLVLFSLPSFVFWLCFLLGLYVFVPGVIISFALVPRRTAQKWAKWMIPLWKWLG